jgi:phosphatidylglycerophosphate synthase
MAKKELRRAVREGQAEKMKKKPGPTIKGAAIKGFLLAAIYLLLVRVVLGPHGRPLVTDLFWAGVFFLMYTGFIFLWDRYLYQRRQRKQGAGK